MRRGGKTKERNQNWFGETKRWYKNYYIVYSALFALTFFLCFFWFFRLGKSFIWYSDGLYTHYNFLAYFRAIFAWSDFKFSSWSAEAPYVGL